MKCLLALVLAVFSAACQQKTPDAAGGASRPVSVEVQLPAGETVPQGSELSIRVVEVSGPDRAIVGSTSVASFDKSGTFVVECTGSRVRDTQSYGLEVAVVAGGKLMFRNASPHYVLTRGNPDRATVPLTKVP
jgi:uncharacterized lipoprotein YbaY